MVPDAILQEDGPLRPNLVTVAHAQYRVRAGALSVVTETVALTKALGRVLAQDVTATRDQPPFKASAMDGYAVRSQDLARRVNPATLKLVGESQAGRAFTGRVSRGQAVRIFTGAAVPAGCDAVVVQENTLAGEGTVTILSDGLKLTRRHVRPTGQDFNCGDVLLKSGERLDPWRLSLVAAAGLDRVTVARRPVIAVLSTGDELVAPGEIPSGDQIFESASHAVMALIKQWGGKPVSLGVGKDTKKSLLRALKTADAELIVTIGGASVGDHDLVKPALAKLGLELSFDGIKVRPGKPTAFGNLKDGRRVLSLPGNPASAFVMAQVLLKAWLETSLGMPPRQDYAHATTTAAIGANGPREAFLRGTCSLSSDGRMQVTPFADQDSSLITVFSRTDALIHLPSGSEAKSPGDLVDILPLDRL
ncbi:gephyrin-like molybdotransferase Glp [Asticcacaulis sp. AC402]|uniref:molybdopterin molybdotransferase MoeA n=1 Tax=Asticcacaulis sp. AC402 TaxID=1282361 RepID=UPI0003C3FE4D|nr:gephyrin-like molybdotransferase Glp [Asticcacaulis sp. AC402]ESQ77225.1 molybdenum cofactor biosynthesis protein [Asticcacaulis sp. AC402]